MEPEGPIFKDDRAVGDVGSRLSRFSDFVGKWWDDPDFDAILPSQRQIDTEKWSEGDGEGRPENASE
jgi:hypothetical protein